MQVKFWAATDVGLTRDHNEDNYLVDKKLNLFVVADGMGGHAAGEIASSVAVHEVRKTLMDQREVIERYATSGSVLQRQTLLALIDSAISKACKLVYQLAQEDSERHGMGTTLSLLLMVRNRAFVGHVGDSRIYRTRNGEVTQVTEDHSVINELIKSGRIKPGDAFNSPYKNAVTRAVGVHPNVEVDTFDFEVKSGDNYLLCSDGLSCYLDDQMTLDFLSIDDVNSIPQVLINHANQSGGKDNITAIIVRAIEVEGMTTSFGIAPPLPPSMNESSSEFEVQDLSFSEVSEDLLDDEIDQEEHTPPPLPPSLDSQVSKSPPSEDQYATLPIDLLKTSPLFILLGNEAIDALCSIAQVITLERESVLALQGESDGALFFILKGALRLERDDQIIGQLEVGETWGENYLLSASKNVESAIAELDSHLLAWSSAALHELMLYHPQLSARLMWGLASIYLRRLEKTQRATEILLEFAEASLNTEQQVNVDVWRTQAKQLVSSSPKSSEVHTSILTLPRYLRDLPTIAAADLEIDRDALEQQLADEVNLLASSKPDKS